MIKPVSAPRPQPLVRREGRFAYWFSRISRALSQQMLLHVRREVGLNLAEFRILTILVECKSASIKDIAAEVSLDKAQVTRAIASLTKRGLTIHMVDGRDRRLRVVKLTPAGRASIAVILPFAVTRQERLERTLTASELRIVWKALAMLSDEAQRMLAEEARMGTGRKRQVQFSKPISARNRRKVIKDANVKVG